MKNIILNENDLWKVFATTFGCKPDKQDCSFKLCNHYSRCVCLAENLIKETDNKSECGVKNG